MLLGQLKQDAWQRWVSLDDMDVEESRALQRLTDLLDLFEKREPLTPDQREKLELAGRGDIKRFFADCEALGRAYELAPKTPDGLSPLLEQAELLRKRLAAGLHRDDSLLAKMLQNVLTPEQRRTWAALERQLSARSPRRADIPAPQMFELAGGRVQQLGPAAP